MDIAMRRTEEGFQGATRPKPDSSAWRKAAKDASRCRLCACESADERCFVKIHGQDQPSCRACWEQLVLDPRRVVSSIVRALI